MLLLERLLLAFSARMMSQWVRRPIGVKVHGKDRPQKVILRISGSNRAFPIRYRHRRPVYCVQSWRATLIGRHIVAQHGVLHAANRGPNAGDDIACNTGIPAYLVSSGPCRIRIGCNVRLDHDIACKSLPCVFARLGLLTRPRPNSRVTKGHLD